MDAPAASASPLQEFLWLTQEVVAAIHRLNRSESLERGRELRLRRRAAGQKPAVDVVDQATGEILDQLPPEAVLRMMAELEKSREGDR
jgi:uncharacterized FlaG/YvyC family protein